MYAEERSRSTVVEVDARLRRSPPIATRRDAGGARALRARSLAVALRAGVAQQDERVAGAPAADRRPRRRRPGAATRRRPPRAAARRRGWRRASSCRCPTSSTRRPASRSRRALRRRRASAEQRAQRRRLARHRLAHRAHRRPSARGLDLEQLAAGRPRARPGASCGAASKRSVEHAAAGSRRTAWQSQSRSTSDVRRQRREARRHLPHVQVVDLDDVRLRRRARCRSPGSSPPARPRGRCGRTRAGATHGRVQHQRGDEQRRDRVGAVEAGRQDHRAGERGAMKAYRSVRTWRKQPSTLRLLAARAGEHERRGEVDGDADERDDERRGAPSTSGGRDEPPDRLVGDPQRRARSSVIPLACALRISTRPRP